MTTPESNAADTPSLHIDSDWKAQAQAEKERLSKKEAEREKTARRRGPDDLPPADFRSLIGILASQAVMSLGGYADPQSGRVVVDLAGAQFAIDLLGVLEAKTASNLDAEESKELGQVLSELRSRFLHFATLVAKQGAVGGGDEPIGDTKTKPIIEMP